MHNRFLLCFLLVISIGISKAQPPDPGVFVAFISWSPDTVQAGSSVHFTALYSSATPPVTNNWDFGDGITMITTDDTINHSYPSPGFYSVRLKAVCDNGDSSEVTRMIEVLPDTNSFAVNFSIYPDTSYPGEPVTFTDMSVAGPGVTLTGSYWYFPHEGNIEHSGFTFQYSFEAPGVYDVLHRVVNSLGDMSSDYKQVVISIPGGLRTKEYCSGNLLELKQYISSGSYQWQVSSDGGITFNNINLADTQYNQSTQPVLQIIHAPASFNGYRYRCITDSSNTLVYKIQVLPSVFTGAINSNWENPSNWSCGAVPGADTDVVINSGTVTINSNATCRTLTVNSGANVVVAPGFSLTVLH